MRDSGASVNAREGKLKPVVIAARFLIPLFVVASVVLVYGVARAQGPMPPVPHAVEGQEKCSLCHGVVEPMPDTHAGRTDETCLVCHATAAVTPAPADTPTPAPTATPAPPTPTPTPAYTPTPLPPGVTPEPASTPTPEATSTPAPEPTRPPDTATPAPTSMIPGTVPHPLEGRELCLTCHDVAGQVPVPDDHQGRARETCLFCHSPGTAEPTSTPAAEGVEPPAAPAGVPHTLLGRENCLMCHAEVAIQPAPSDHVGRGNDICQVCHQPSQPVPPGGGSAALPASPLSLREEQSQCLTCHGDPALTATMSNGNEVSLYVDAELKENSAHRYIRCTTCHSSEPHEIETPLSKLSLAAKCGACHSYQYELHLGSIHGQQLVQGNADVATCVDCHSSDKTPHSVVRVLEYGAPTFKKNIAETCGECHGNESLMARYGIVGKVYESYMRSFHGKAIQLASYDLRQLNKATCTSCHGTHDIQNPHDVDSPLAGMENLASTCEECHEGAGVEFVSGFLGHREVSSESAPAAFYTERLFIVLTAGVAALGVGVVLLAAVRWGLHGWREEH